MLIFPFGLHKPQVFIDKISLTQRHRAHREKNQLTADLREPPRTKPSLTQRHRGHREREPFVFDANSIEFSSKGRVKKKTLSIYPF